MSAPEEARRINDPNVDGKSAARYVLQLGMAGDDCRDKLGKVKQWVEAQK